jgi:hypothetical protein
VLGFPQLDALLEALRYPAQPAAEERERPECNHLQHQVWLQTIMIRTKQTMIAMMILLFAADMSFISTGTMLNPNPNPPQSK